MMMKQNDLLSRRLFLGLAGYAAIPHLTWAMQRRSTLTLETADGRISQIMVWTTVKRRHGIILFSHGALSSPAKYEALIAPWVSAGFDVFAPLHVDSTNHPDTAHFPGLTSWPARLEDMRALAKHIGGKPYVAAGHSYGALVALTLGGVRAVIPSGMTLPLRDRHVKAVIAFSPPGAAPGLVDAKGYAALAVPAFIETGTNDVPPGATEPESWKRHLLAYDSVATEGDRYAFVLEGVDHYFGGVICRPELPGPKQSRQFDIATKISTEFLCAYGAHDLTAKAALIANLSDSGAVRLAKK